MIFTRRHDDNIACPNGIVFAIYGDDADPLQKDKHLVYVVNMARFRVSGLSWFENIDTAACDLGFTQDVRQEQRATVVEIVNRKSSHLILLLTPNE
jgi:hypothetical protein